MNKAFQAHRISNRFLLSTFLGGLLLAIVTFTKGNEDE